MREPLVSVIVPVYNGEKYLRQSIKSILRQSYPKFELIVIDDGSTDKTPSILKSFTDKRMRVITQKNKGVSAARNIALKNAQGEYVAMHDSDDISDKYRLEKQVSYLERHKDIGLVGSNYEVIDTNNRLLDTTDVFTHPDDLKIAIILSNQFGQGSVMIRQELLKEAGYDNHFKLGEDFDLWNRLSRKTKIANLRDCLYRWRYYEDSTWTSNREGMRRYIKEVRDREFKNYLANRSSYHFVSFHPFSTRGGVKRYLEKKSLVCRNVSYLYLSNGQRQFAVRILLLGMVYAFWDTKNYKYLIQVCRKRPLEHLEYEGI